MTDKFELFMETLLVPLSWMPDFMLGILGTLVGVFAVLVLVALVAKVVDIFT